MSTCPHCHEKTDKDLATCTSCGQELSVPDDSLDDMIAAASQPSLASLFKAGKQAGLIKPVSDYGHNS